MRRAFMLVFLLATGPALAAADSGPVSQTPPIALPSDGDDYSRLAAQAASHDAATDFRALRFAWLTSAARRRHDERSLADQRRQMGEAVRDHDIALVRDRAAALLSLEYIDLQGQKLLRQSCALLQDQACADQAHFVEFGLLNSIIHSGDGKTCPTGWDVAMIGEEYFILSMLETTVLQQALVRGENGHSCDAMTVKDEKGEQRVYYFRIDQVMADEAAMLGLKH